MSSFTLSHNKVPFEAMQQTGESTRHLCQGARLQKHLESTALQVPHHEKHVVSDRLCYYKPKAEHRKRTFAEELSVSLRHSPKFISPKFLYDQRGSELFEEICGLPEYYLTRTEIGIISQAKGELREFLAGDFRLVELGSGSSVKTRHLLDVLEASESRTEYVPIDISEFSEEGMADLLGHYENLSIVGIIDTYEHGLRFMSSRRGPNNLIAFFGSSFGNFPFKEGGAFLKNVRESMGDGDLFLIGLDLVKDRSVLESAYNDSRGVTARFNLNVLERINGELGGDFDPDGFAHHSVYNEGEERIEMYLRSLRRQSVLIPKAGLLLSLEENELIHTENSHKFSVPKINSMMKQAGFDVLRLWQDPERRFAVLLASKYQPS